MLGAVKHITPDINNQPWDMAMSGFEFEDYITSVIEHALSKLFRFGLTVERTPRTRDNGKDLIIRSPIAFTLFGKSFHSRGKSEICVYVEFKSSQISKIGLDKFSKNILLANNSEIDYFVLITNTTIAPFSYHEASRNGSENNYSFHLVDQYLLARFLTENDAIYGSYSEITNPSPLSVSYQIDFGRRNGQAYLDLYILFRNNTAKPQVCRFELKTDRNWWASEPQFDVFLDVGESKSRHIGVKKEHFDGIDDIFISLTLDNTQKNLVIHGASVEYNFETPLVGRYHKVIIANIIATARDNTSIKLINLSGEAGIGKTRILYEAEKELRQNGIEWFHFLCSTDKTVDTGNSLVEFLQTKLQRPNISKPEDIADIPMHFKRYAIVIEDIHNADKSLFSQLRDLSDCKHSNTPFTIITAGRNDSSVFNEPYFTFLSWLDKCSEQENIYQYNVTKLDDTDCRRLIGAIVVGAPEFVAERIHHASENNPFYICQYIEYLLETKLIYLVNRSTVGVTNVSTFAQKLYIPESIDALLEERYRALAQNPGGEKLQEFLLLLGFYGIEAPKDIYHMFFSDSSYSDVELLYKTHFLRFSNENAIIFDHENLFAFCRKKALEPTNLRHLSYLLAQRPRLMALYPTLRRAMAYFFLDNLPECEKLLEQPITEIRAIKNVSSCNLTPRFYEVYKLIYEIAIKRGNADLQRKTILARLYVALHNLSVARGSIEIEDVKTVIENFHADDIKLSLTARQLQAHLYMQSDQISQAKKLLLELVAQERINSGFFDDETRFDLFDRIASVYVQENHKEIADAYNQLSREVAEKLSDRKLLTLSKIIAAKIEFYTNTHKAHELMLEAKSLLAADVSRRINCHNNLGILTAELVLNYGDTSHLPKLRLEGQQLLQEAIVVEYPGAIIRCNCLLAIMHYMSDDIPNAVSQTEMYINVGITDSLRNGISKNMPQLYCMLAISAARKGAQKEQIYRYFQTMLQHMRQCDQFFLGALDFTYNNVILLTNYAIFLCEYGLESEVYKFLGEIRYYGSNTLCDSACDNNRICFTSCQKSMDIFRQNYKSIRDGGLLFMDKRVRYGVRDAHTPFYIPLGV